MAVLLNLLEEVPNIEAMNADTQPEPGLIDCRFFDQESTVEWMNLPTPLRGRRTDGASSARQRPVPERQGGRKCPLCPIGGE